MSVQRKSSDEWEGELFRFLMENVSEYALFVTDAQQYVCAWSSAAERLLGWAESEILGVSVERFFTPEDRARGAPAQDIHHALSNGRGVDDRWIVRKDGSRFLASTVTTPLWDEAGELRGFARIIRDLTDCRRQEAAHAEQMRLAAFGRDIGLALSRELSLRSMLADCAAAAIVHLPVALAQIWTLDETREALELQSSAGSDGPLNGSPFRIPLGRSVLGRIARERRPYLTNDVRDAQMAPDLRGHDLPVDGPEGTGREKIVAFAGYPLLVDDRVIGVMAVAAEQPLSYPVHAALAAISSELAVGIERKLAEQRLREQQEWLQVTLASIGDAVITTDPSGRMTFLNSVARKLTDGESQEAAGKPLDAVFQIIDEQTGQAIENPVAMTLREGAAVTLANHTLLIGRSGEARPIDGRAAPIRNSSGEMIGVALVFRDVTEKRRAERELEVGEQRKAAILETALDAIITIDHQGRVVEFNPAAARSFGYSREEAVQREVSELIIPPSLREAHRAGFERCVATGEAAVLNRRLELSALRRDGTQFPIELVITRIPTDGPPVFTAYLRDISDRVRIEQRRNARLVITHILAEAQEPRQTMQAVLRAICEGLDWDLGIFWTVDADADVLRCSESWRRPGLEVSEFEQQSRQRVFRRGEGFLGQVWASGEPYCLVNVTDAADFTRAALAAKDGLHGAFAVPLAINHDCIGVIEFFSREVREADPDLLEMMLTVALQVAQCLERQRAEERLREQRLVAETLNRIGNILAAELDLQKIVQMVTDEGTSLTGAEFGAFFYNLRNEHGESYTLYTLSGVPREAFANFPMPRNTQIFSPTFRGEAVVRLDDVTKDSRYGRNPPYRGMPAGHLPVRSYLAVPVVSRSGEVLGGLFFGHSTAGMFNERHEQILVGVAAQAAIAIDNARLYQQTQESEERFRQLAEHIHDVFWMLDPLRPAMLYVSPAYETIWGRSRQSLYENPRSFLDAVHPEDRPMVAASFEQQRLGVATTDEYRILQPDGTLRWVWDRAFPIRDSSGKIYRIAGIIEDITERKQSERAARFLADASSMLAALVDYESTLQKVAGLAVPGFADWCAVDLVEADNSLRRLAVVHVDPAKVHLAAELDQKYPADPNSAHGVYRVLRTGAPQILEEISDEVLAEVARDEAHLHLLRELGLKSFICVPLQTRNKTLGVLSFVYAESGRRYGAGDLSLAGELAHRAAIAIENARLYADLREADRRKDEFLAMLAHELRNPLAPIRTGLDVLALKPDQEVQSETIELMQQQVGHLVRLVDDLLDVSRIIRGKIELRREPVELATVIKQSVVAIRSSVEERKQEIVVSLPSQPIWLDADPVRLVQVIENLLNNASKYTDHGGRITISGELEEGKTLIRVSDNGIGIEPDLLSKVFELFTQSTRTLDRSQGGLGIGLTLVRSLVEMHGGEVAAFSDGPGKGSRFEVRLPTATSRTTVGPQPAEYPMSEGRKVLVVDDNVGAAKMLSLLVKRLGPHEVEMAHDGPSALEVAGRFLPEIILLDIGLPRMDGLAVAWTLREDDKFDKTLLVALTGYGQDEDRRKSKEAGFDEHLVKPIDIETLKQMLQHPKLTS